jgi:hypothetical protein
LYFYSTVRRTLKVFQTGTNKNIKNIYKKNPKREKNENEIPYKTEHDARTGKT